MSNALWAYFYKGEKQNKSHFHSYCKGCVKHQQELLQDAGTYNATDWREGGQSFTNGKFPGFYVTCTNAGAVRGDRGPWITHILGGRGVAACPHALALAKKEAAAQKETETAKKAPGPIASGSGSSGAPPAASSVASLLHGRSNSADTSELPAPKRLKQGFFQVFNAKDQEFTTAERDAFEAQVLRAMISAGISFRAWENPEMKKAIGMLRSAAPGILPSRKVVAGRLLDEAAEIIEGKVKRALQGREIGLVSDGWRSRKKMDVSALCANSECPLTLGKLLDMTAQNKDGVALCKLFGEMIDRVQLLYACLFIFFGTDADGGSRNGRYRLGKLRPWLFVPSCWAHQFQLILGDYFKVFAYAAEIAEKATGLIGWINNHGKVRKIFDAVQAQLTQERFNRIIVLAYLVANLTRWTTHCVAFLRLLVLQEYLRFAVMQNRGAIVTAQVGAAKSTEAERLREEAEEYCHCSIPIFYCYCDLILSNEFWSGLTMVVSDIEPICYGTNINQKDSTRADLVLLTLAGLYLHYKVHAEPEVSKDLVARIEKRWKDCDQPLFLVALILNPFEGLSCFGPWANFDHFKATALVVELYRRLSSRPENTDSPAEKDAKAKLIANEMFQYLLCTGAYQNWNDARNQFEETMGRDPIAVWTALDRDNCELPRFALTILRVVVNQAGCERVFSDVKNTESPRRSRLGLEKLEKMTKINASVKADHINEGLVASRKQRQNHKSVEKLLAVPRYHDLLEDQGDEDESERGCLLVSSRIAWRVDVARWVSAARAAALEDAAADAEETADEAADAAPQHPSLPLPKKKWVKTTLTVLFGGAKKPVTKLPRTDLDREAELMEALADAEEDARLDDGAVDDSADDYEP
ncbi:ribonuclease H-like domain-containing protein [Mycena sp. CBHHK59/15]|nr:ribonuclease H-like domain-containing protein [Mycena sp. CBHHK59/15]